MDIPPFSTWSREDLLIGGVLAAVLVLLIVLGLRARGRRPSKHVQTVSCPGCGWVGHVSRYAGRCPECNTPIGDGAARTGR